MDLRFKDNFYVWEFKLWGPLQEPFKNTISIAEKPIDKINGILKILNSKKGREK